MSFFFVPAAGALTPAPPAGGSDLRFPARFARSTHFNPGHRQPPQDQGISPALPGPPEISFCPESKEKPAKTFLGLYGLSEKPSFFVVFLNCLTSPTQAEAWRSRGRSPRLPVDRMVTVRDTGRSRSSRRCRGIRAERGGAGAEVTPSFTAQATAAERSRCQRPRRGCRR